VRGAAGIPVTRPLRPDPPLWLLRPLLEVPRADIEAYAREHGLSWIDDESNEDPRRGRTFLAREVIALLRARYPDCEAALSRAGRHFAQAESLLQVLGGEDLARCREPGSGIRIDRLAALGEQRAANALRVALACAGCRPPSNDRAREILRQFLHARPDAQPGVVVDGIVIRRFRGAIHLVRPVSGPPADPVAWRGEAAVAWGEARVVFEDAAGSGIRRSATGSGAWVLRTRQGGEYIRLADNRPRRTLKNAFQEEGVPPWERDVLPLLWRDGDLVWVAGVGVAADYRCPDGEPGITPRLVSGVRPALLHSEGG
jgi:tRNA(Ile)-lysidine synthase